MVRVSICWRTVALLGVFVVLVLPADALGSGLPTHTQTGAGGWTCPVRSGGRISQGNGGGRTHDHPQSQYAFDYQLAEGTAVVAARDGTVTEAVDHHTLGGPDKRYEDMANRVVLRHADGTRSVYVHLMPGGAHVRVGERVMRGEIVGYSGNTGFSSGPHLHFAVVDSLGVSIPVHFTDFDRSDGVPEQGDHHGAAPRPALPQTLIDSMRVRLRAAADAERKGWPEIGLLVSGGRGPRSARGVHALDSELDAARDRCTQALWRLADEVRALSEPDSDTLFRLVRAEAAVELAQAPRDLRHSLHAARRSLADTSAQEATALGSVAARVVRIMVRECREEAGAAQAWAALLRHAQEPIRAFAETRFDHLVKTVLAAHGQDVARLRRSAREAEPRHERALLLHAEATLRIHRDLLEDAAGATPTRGAELRAALRRLRAGHRAIATLLS